MKKGLLILSAIFTLLLSCQPTGNKEARADDKKKHIGEVIRLSPELDNIIAKDAKIEVLADGFEWTEGPLWVEDGNYLLFSDIPHNSIFKWQEDEGVTLYLKPSGYTGEPKSLGEPGSNGLLLNAKGELVLCQHGDRRLAVMEAPLSDPSSKFRTLADKYDDMRFNSPNDAVYDESGNLYFTDPMYGLEGKMDDPAKEIPFQGVYRLLVDGTVELITKELERPNGIGISPDGKTLYVANSYSDRPIIMSFPIGEDNAVGKGKVFFDTKHLKVNGAKGSPDGLKVSQSGLVYATGPGGILILDKSGKHLGTVSSGEATANCALDAGEGYLYGTSDMYLIRVKLKS